MKEVPQKNTGDELSADEYSLCTSLECQNTVLNTDQTLNENNLNQQTQAIVRIGNLSSTFKDQTGMVSNNYILTLDTAFNQCNFTTYFEGMTLQFIVDNVNTGSVTLNIDSLGAVPLLNSSNTALTGGELLPNVVHYVKYVGTNFVLYNYNSGDIALPKIRAACRVTASGSTPVEFINLYNVASVDRLSVGNFKINYATPFPTTNYGIVTMGDFENTSSVVSVTYKAADVLTTSCVINTIVQTGTISPSEANKPFTVAIIY